MRQRWILWTGAIVATVLLSTAAKVNHTLDEQWRNPDYERRKFQNMIVVGITLDVQARKNFENKFVSFLRGKSIGGVTSYSMAPNLANPPSRDAILEQITAQGIDGAISVRLVPLVGKTAEDDWGEVWNEQIQRGETLRELVQDTLPLQTVKTKSYGVEVALWDAKSGTRVWSGRTPPYKKSQLSKNTGEFVSMVMYALKWDQFM
jgi:hypothetical protein